MVFRREAVEERLKELGEILRYLQIDPNEVHMSFEKGLTVFPRFIREILAWLDALEQQGGYEEKM